MAYPLIQSLSNPHVKMIRGLKLKKNREKEDVFLADGDLLAEEALKSGAPVVELLFDAEKEAVMAPILALAEEKNVRITAVSRAVMEGICETQTPQGIAVLVRLPENRLPEGGERVICLLEDVADPGNVGTIIRTADAVGADAVLLAGACADAYAPKTVRATMGSLFHLSVLHVGNAVDAAGFYRQRGYRAVGTHLHGTDAFDPAVPWQGKTLLITGSEARGMSEELSRCCDDLLKLPMPGKSESLNAGIATGVFLYTWLRAQR